MNTTRKFDLAKPSPSASTKTPETVHKHSEVQTHSADIASAESSDRAAGMNADAYKALQTLEQLLDRTLDVDQPVDWDNLVNAEAFESTLTSRPYILYGELGAPVDIEYLSMPNPKPKEPELTPRPVLSDFKPQLGVLDKLAFREQRLVKDGQDAFSEALRKWEADRQQSMATYVRESNQWIESAKAMDAENEQRYRQCVEDQQLWLKQKQLFDEKCHEAQLSIDSFKQAYSQRTPSAAQL